MSLQRVVLAGPTGIGKTAISLEMARSGQYSVISADSRQCFRGMDIGTGKVTRAEMGPVTHYNIDVLDPSEPDSAAAFVRRARDWEADILRRGQTPLIVGGSTLHVQSLIWPLDDVPAACVQNQVKLSQQERVEGPEFLQTWLQRVDPEYAQQMDGYNRQRIFRALDVYMQSGRPFSAFHSEQNLAEVPADTVLVVLTCERGELVRRIEQRVRGMVASGLIEETRRLLDGGLSGTEQALQTVGYREAIEFLRGGFGEAAGQAVVRAAMTPGRPSAGAGGETAMLPAVQASIEAMTEAILVSTRQYAKRQATWFRRWKSAQFFDITGMSAADASAGIIRRFDLPF
jgi:tRNA dimethylallyltransferase